MQTKTAAILSNTYRYQSDILHLLEDQPLLDNYKSVYKDCSNRKNFNVLMFVWLGIFYLQINLG